MHNLPSARSLSDGAGIILWASKPVKRALGIIVGMERSEQTTPPHEAGRANTAVHSITKSARAKSDRGAARFCALTIFKRLMNVETAVVSFRAAVSIRCIATLNLFGTAAICQCGAVYDGSSSLGSRGKLLPHQANGRGKLNAGSVEAGNCVQKC